MKTQSVTLAAPQFRRLVKQARENGVTVSEYLRWIVRDHLGEDDGKSGNSGKPPSAG
jgi:hypothetical protein